MRRCVALVLVAGCGFSVSEAPGDGGGDSARPDAAGSDSDSGAGSGTSDSDADGVLDAADNCPQVSNATQRDHDGDAIGDACDPCPHLAKPGNSTTEPDADGDGVGDQCDPNPATATDKRVLFEGFYDAASLGGWSASAGWSVAGGKLHQPGLSAAVATPNLVAKRAFVTTELAIVSTTTSSIAGVSAVAMMQRLDCAISREGTTARVRVDNTWGVNSQIHTNDAWNGTYATGSSVRLTMDLRVQNDCRAVQGSTVAATTGAYGPSTLGVIYLGMTGVAVDFDYLFIVDQTP